MRKNPYIVVVLVLLVVVVLVALNGDRLYDWLIQMHGGKSHH